MSHQDDDIRDDVDDHSDQLLTLKNDLSNLNDEVEEVRDEQERISRRLDNLIEVVNQFAAKVELMRRQIPPLD
jgi:chromosome segregation ATPase